MTTMSDDSRIPPLTERTSPTARMRPATRVPAAHGDDGTHSAHLVSLVFAAGSYPDPLPPLPDADVVIAADGGLDTLRRR